MSANVRSLEAIQAVRAALVVFRDELEQALSMIDLEMRHVLDWLEHDRPRFWRRQRPRRPRRRDRGPRGTPPLPDVPDQRRAAVLLRRTRRAQEGRGPARLLRRKIGTPAALDPRSSPRDVRIRRPHQPNERRGRNRHAAGDGDSRSPARAPARIPGDPPPAADSTFRISAASESSPAN